MALRLVVAFAPLVASQYLLNDDTPSQRLKGCHTITAGVTTLAMTSPTACGGRRCPTCFYFDTGPVQLSLSSCGSDSFSSAHSVQSLVGYRIVNKAEQAASISDGTGTSSHKFLINGKGQPGSSVSCWCNPSHNLYCDAPVLSVMYTAAMNTGSDSKRVCMTVDHTNQDKNGDYCNSVSGCELDFEDGTGVSTCGYTYCATCIMFDTSTYDLTVTISKCSFFRGLNQAGSAATVFQFSATGGKKVTVKDAQTTYTLQGGAGHGFSIASCFCENHLLACNIPTARLNSESTGVASFPEHVRVGTQLQFADDNTYINYNSGLNFYIWDGATTGRSVSMTADGGTLHGAWSVDSAFVTSDRRLKRSIEPIGKTLQHYLESATLDADSAVETAAAGMVGAPLLPPTNQSARAAAVAGGAWERPPAATAVASFVSDGVGVAGPSAGATAAATAADVIDSAHDEHWADQPGAAVANPAGVFGLAPRPGPEGVGVEDPVLWFLDRLMPVSYIARRDEAGGRRFGFIADDLEKILPDIVRIDPKDEDRTKRVHLQDLIALLAAAAQCQQRRLVAMERRQSELERQVALLSARLEAAGIGGGVSLKRS